jgi:hypothetical protein
MGAPGPHGGPPYVTHILRAGRLSSRAVPGRQLRGPVFAVRYPYGQDVLRRDTQQPANHLAACPRPGTLPELHRHRHAHGRPRHEQYFPVSQASLNPSQ